MTFASPFDELGPSELARRAAEALQAELRAGRFPALDAAGGGKMFGVLVAETADGRREVLRAFSGMLDGSFDVPGFAPPLFDRAARAAVEPAGEALVKNLLARAEAFAASPEVAALRRAAGALVARHAELGAALREEHRRRRAVRRERRAAYVEVPGTLGREALLVALARESRADKSARRALDTAQAAERRGIDRRLRRVDRRLAAFERLRRFVCRRLMQRIHDTYRIGNARGETRSLRALWAPSEPPSGAGDCVAPKLLADAYARGLRPLAMAELWWGAPPAGGGRVAGAFYPACRDKCGPLLAFMMQGLAVAAARRFLPPSAETLHLRILFADQHIVIVDKPPGLLSVPARDGRFDSVLARLRREHSGTWLVHRLDLGTSGLLVAARDPVTYKAMQRQFTRRTIEKRYVAIVAGPVRGDGGVIDLPIRGDLDDRPRQIHDPVHGREAITEWRRASSIPDGTSLDTDASTRIVFHPRTGRTHQLRVHAAHPLGLGVPIVGDRLYGYGGERLMLHAETLTFIHPGTGERMTFHSAVPF